MKLKALILDDEKENIEHLSYWIEKYCAQQIEVVDTATTIAAALSGVQEYHPDVLFLDVELANGVKSFELLEKIPEWEGKIIFITAHKNYAIQAIKAQAYDYLLKPLSINELIETIENVYASFEGLSEQTRKETQSLSRTPIDFVAISHLNEIQLLRTKDIMYLASSGNYTEFFLVDGTTSISSKIIKIYESILIGKNFIRIHHSYMINLDYLSKIEKESGWTCIMKDGKGIPVSRRKKDILVNLLNPT